MFKTIVTLFLLMIIGSLFLGLVSLLRDRGETLYTVKALTLRIGLSLILFLLIMIAYATGFIIPHGL